METDSHLKLCYNNLPIELLVNMRSIGIGGDKWPAAEQFCEFVSDARWLSFHRQLFQSKGVLELGSGTGLAGIIVDKLFNPTNVIITDIGDHVELIAKNLSLNNTTNAHAQDLDWMNPQIDSTFDIVLAFECVYSESLFQPLINTFRAACHKDTIIYLGLTRLFAKPIFFDMLRKAGFTYTMIPQEAMPNAYSNETNGRDTGLFVIRSTE